MFLALSTAFAVSVVSFHLQAQLFLTNGLVAYYPFNNGNANDMAGTNNGISYGATLTADRFGNPNSAYYFNGSNSYIQTVYPMQDLTNATFSVWFNANKVSASQGVFLSDSIPVPGYSWACDLIPVGNGAGIYATGHGGQGVTITNGVGNFTQKITNNWLHFVYVMQPTNQQLFVNGILIANVNTNANDIGGHSSGFVIGADASANPYYKYFSGAIDDVRIYKRALSSSEVYQLYALESGQEVSLIKAVTLQDYSLTVGSNYQVQVSTDLINWTNQGPVFTATSSYWQSTNYWQVANWNQLFFRIVQQ